MKRIFLLCGMIMLILMVSQQSKAQFFKKLADEISERVEDKVINDAGDAAVKGVDKTEEAIGDAATNSNKDSRKAGRNTPPSQTTKNAQKGNNNIPGKPGTHAKGKTGGIPAKQGIGKVNVNYDFKAGERTIFETDFSNAVVGNFPRNLTFHGGSMSVVSYSGGRALRVNTRSGFIIDLPEKLPERFTIQFEVYNTTSGNDLVVKVVDADSKPAGAHFINISGFYGMGVDAYESDGITALHETLDIINKQMTPVSVMVDGAYAKVYVNKQRMANMPNADLGRSNRLLFEFTDVKEGEYTYIKNLRIAAGGRDLYSAIEAEGRVAVQDILFATGKSTILPKSEKAIAEIATLLKEHPDLNLLIEGHTDNVGEFADNMKLSKARADAVKSYLIENYQINAERLQTMGMGESRPTASNETEEGRAENRRVEIAKM